MIMYAGYSRLQNAHTGCVILIDFPLQQWLHERASLSVLLRIVSRTEENTVDMHSVDGVYEP